MPKICFHREEYIYKTHRKWFPIVGERFLCKKLVHLNLNNDFHQHKICSEQKSTRKKNPFPLVGMNSIRQKIRFHQPEKLLPLLRNEKSEENWFTQNFSDAFQQQKKKALNKSSWFEVSPKSIYTSRDEEFDEKSVSTSRKKLLPLAGISAKILENGFNE